MVKMAYPTTEEFSDAVMSRPLGDVVEEYLFQGTPFGAVPYVFRMRQGDMQVLTDHLSSALQVKPENIVVVGSAKIGFSLSPDKYYQPFTNRSDIDVVIVDENLFDTIW